LDYSPINGVEETRTSPGWSRTSARKGPAPASARSSPPWRP